MGERWNKIAFFVRSSLVDARPAYYTNVFQPSLYARRIQILLVEDDEPDAYLIRRALAGNPRVREVILAENGVEALQLIDRGEVSPDLAIVDLHMPRKNGFELMHDFAIRDGARFPSVVLTSSASGADALRAAHCGAVEFVTKPDTVEKLAVALDRAIFNAV